MENSNIKQAQISDLKAIQNCAEKAYLPYVSVIGKKPAPMKSDFLKLISENSAYVLHYEGHFAGFIICYSKDRYYHVENVAILPDFQNKGLGRVLLAFAEEQAKKEQITIVSLYTNEKMSANLKFYPKLGYVEVARKEQDGFNRVFFEKEI